MTTLHDRLAELAEDAPPGVPGPDLWARGRRYHRVRRAGTAVIAVTACLALVAIVGLSWQRSGSTPEPAAPPDGTRGLPDQLYTPSPWLSGTDDAGPLGPLAVVVPAERKSWTGTGEGLAGVSATTGEYRFLDLPDRTGPVALSPDGFHLAYWVTGDAAGSPNEDRPVTGVAVYDSRTGEVRRHDIETEHGLGVNALLWAGDGDLVLDYGQYRGGEGDDPNDQASVTPYEQFRWQLDREAPEPLPMPDGVRDPTIAGGGEGRVVLQDGDSYWNYDPDELALTFPSLGKADFEFNTTPVFSLLYRFATISGTSNPNSILVGDANGEGGAETKVVPESQGTFEVLAWNGIDQLVVKRDADAPDPAHENASVFRVDVGTGRSVELVSLASAGDVRQVQFASDLFAEPTLDGQRPPDPIDPRGIAGLVGLTVLGGFVGIVGWRRRVRP